MAKCAICEKGAHFGNNVSHSHRRSNKMWKSNVKSVKVKVDGGGGGFSSSDSIRSFMSFGGRDRWQNSRPVASQFRADPKPREASHREEPPVADTFSPGFQRLRAVASLKSRRVQPAAGSQSADVGGLTEGCVIEHERFGMGKVTRLEGSGENMKATVQFENAGTKQLLVKFARFKVVG